MHLIKALLLFTCLCIAHALSAQQYGNDVDINSYSLYEKGDWKGLLTYGREAVNNGTDFLLLRLRMAYAAVMLGNYSEAIRQYEDVLVKDKDNQTAHYYLWLCHGYLNQPEMATRHTAFLTDEVISANKIKPFMLTAAGVEVSYKATDALTRNDGLYTRADAGIQLNRNWHMWQSGGLFNQTINEPKIQINNNRNIAINQQEYYNRSTINLSNTLQAKVAYHYVHTTFNTLTYHNNAGLFGIRYIRPYVNVQADAIVAQVSDTGRQQFNFQVGVYPLGNLNLYAHSILMLRSGKTGGTNVRQIIGFRAMKNTWLELNGTFGRFTNLFENDAVYLYNAIDPTTLKCGGTVYLTLSKHILVQAAYTYEQKEFFNTNVLFTQHSITGGILWKM